MRSFRILATCSLVAMLILPAEDCLAQRSFGGGGGMQGGGAFAGGFQSGRQAENAAIRDRIKARSYKFEPTGETLSYAVFLPRKYDPKKPMPLIILLHGNNVPPESIITPFGTAADKHGYILVAPMGYALSGWYGMHGLGNPQTAKYSEQDVMTVLDLARAEFNIDPRRIYIAGHSMGGSGAVHIAAAHPEIWAAVGTLSGPAMGNTPAENQNLANLPIIVEQGDKDELVPVDGVRQWVEKLKQRGAPTQYYEFRGGTHVTTLQQGAERVLAFFDKYSRPEAETAH